MIYHGDTEGTEDTNKNQLRVLCVSVVKFSK